MNPPPYSTQPTRGHGSQFSQIRDGQKTENRVLLSTCPMKIRQDFIRKVYSILFLQIAFTWATSAFIFDSPSIHSWILAHEWILYGCFFGAVINVVALMANEHSYPLNYILLASFTAIEGLTLGVALSKLPQALVLQALIITIGVFLSLTIFTFQSKWDFSGLGPFLYSGLVSLIMAGIARSFIPTSSFPDTLYALGGSLVFSGYIVLDTYQLITKLSPDEFIRGSLELYLDFVSLFLYILQFLLEAEKKKKEEEAKKKEKRTK